MTSLRESTCTVCLHLFKSSCSPRIKLPPVPDNLKDRIARFGYIIDDAFQRNYYENMETDDVVKEEDYRNRYTKEDIVRRAIRLSNCTPSILSFKTDKTQRSDTLRFLCVSQSSVYSPTPSHCRGTSQIQGGFVPKEKSSVVCVCSGMCMVSVFRIVYIAYLHIQCNATQIMSFSSCV
jgi:hypothetical protein